MTASERLLATLKSRHTFQISVDVDTIGLGLTVAEAAVRGGIDLIEMGTPLLKVEGVRNVIPAFRRQFPDAVLLADMKTMDGGGFEARSVYAGGGNIIDFLAAAGFDTARAACAVRDEYRDADPTIARLAFADILLPQQGSAERAVEVAERMLEAGVDGVGLHLQHDARRADPVLWQSSYLADVAQAVFERVGQRASVQVVGGLSTAQAVGLSRAGLKAFVISGNLGVADAQARYTIAPVEIERHVAAFIADVRAG